MKTMDSSSSFSSQFHDDSSASIASGFSAERICGESASCTVYRMRINGQQVAVKRLRKHLTTDPVYVSAYRKEYLIGTRLKHDALPIYRALHADMDEVYIVMDYIDGVSVADFIKTEEGKQYFRDIANVRRFLTQLLDVVTYMHRTGVIHCDLKTTNIMLRHSDRGVMIFDLDKAYCDTLDLTHGGTSGVSDIVNQGEKPNAKKDITAIGRIIDIIAEEIPEFPLRKFNHFRKHCNTMNFSEDKLFRALEPTGSWVKWAGIGVAVLLAATISANSLLNNRTAVATDNQGPASRDTIMLKESESSETAQSHIPNSLAQDKPDAKVEPQPITESKQDTTDIVIPDFDIRMEKFIKDTEKALVTLRTKKLSNEEFQNLVTHVSELYTSTFNETVSDYKKKYPDKSEFDVYTAVIKASGTSKAFKLMNVYSKEMVDSLNARNARI